MCVCLIVLCHCGMEGREESKKKERKEKGGKDGVFNLLSTGEQRGRT